MAKSKAASIFSLTINAPKPRSGKVKTRSRRDVQAEYRNTAEKNRMRSQMMEDAAGSVYDSFYAGIDPRRRIEMADGGIVEEDNTAMANLPTRGFQRQFPRAGYESNPYIQDTFSSFADDDISWEND